MEKPLDVLQDLYQKTDLVRSILSLLLDAMTAGCDPWKTPYVVTVSHMAEMVEEIQTELLAATEELFREGRKAQKTDVYGLVSFGEVLLAQKYPKLGDLSHGPQTPTGDQRERFSLWKPFRQSGADWESRKRQHRDFERAEFALNFFIFFKKARKKQPFSV